MKKATIGNFVIIIGLLVLCVTTLIAVYAITPDSSVLILDENFNVLNEDKWKHKVSECKQGNEQFFYETEYLNNKLTADGLLHIHTNLTDENLRKKRESAKNFSGNNSKNSSDDCITSFISGEIQSKEKFDAESGWIEIRAKLRAGNFTQFYIGISFSQNEAQPDGLEDFSKLENETTTSNATELKIFFESDLRRNVLKSEIPDNEFHVYEIHWKNDKIYLNVDSKKVDEKEFKRVNLNEENYSNETMKLVYNTPISQPFYLSLGVKIGQNYPEHTESYLNSKSSQSKTSYNEEIGEMNEIEVDYVRLFRNLS